MQAYIERDGRVGVIQTEAGRHGASEKRLR